MTSHYAVESVRQPRADILAEKGRSREARSTRWLAQHVMKPLPHNLLPTLRPPAVKVPIYVTTTLAPPPCDTPGVRIDAAASTKCLAPLGDSVQ